MPPTKQPDSLTELCLRRAAIMALKACIAIEDRHGCNSNCTRDINILRNHFLESIGHSFEEVCSEINRYVYPLHSGTYRCSVLDLTFHEKRNEISLSPVVRRADISMHLTSTFWAEKLSGLKKITTLNISFIDCTEEIIEAISNNCTHLEQLHLRSNSTTDKCILLLRKCVNLLIIRDVSLVQEVSVNTIQQLIIGLPRLIDINYHRMGEVLSSGFENMVLPLRSVQENTAEARHVEAIVQLCPKLTRLTLMKNRLCSDEILNSLIDCNLEVVWLELRGFTSSHVAPLLREKGKYLHTLSIIIPQTYNTKEDITSIGLNCPSLEHFTWMTYGPNGRIDVDHPYKMSKQEEQQIFVNLRTLTLCIQAADFDNRILQLCLRNASNIEDNKMVLVDENDTSTDLQEMFTEILTTNKMTHLKLLQISGFNAFGLSTKTLDLIFNNLNNLQLFKCYSEMNAEVLEYFQKMKSKILESNLNLEMVLVNLLN